MPRAPRPAARAGRLRASTFVAFERRLRERAAAGDLIPLHLGESALPPPAAALALDLADPGLHRYGPVGGDPDLRAAAAADLRRRGLDASAERVFATPGATGGLDVAVDAVLDPGDEVLVLSPSWPLIRGILARHGVRAIDVPVGEGGGLELAGEELARRLDAAVTPRTAGVYLCDPNNPAGFVYGQDHRAGIAEVARRHDLWLFLDAVYGDLTFADGGAPPLGFVDAALAERTFVVVSWSKDFSLAGHRAGALATPPALAALAPRLITHTTYHAPRTGQRMALAALGAPDAPAERARRRQAARDGAARVAELLTAVRFPAPTAGTFVLLDLRARCPDEAAALDLLARCLDAGVSLAPGSAFGVGFERFARLCFTAVDPPDLEEGLRRLEGILG